MGSRRKKSAAIAAQEMASYAADNGKQAAFFAERCRRGPVWATTPRPLLRQDARCPPAGGGCDRSVGGRHAVARPNWRAGSTWCGSAAVRQHTAWLRHVHADAACPTTPARARIIPGTACVASHRRGCTVTASFARRRFRRWGRGPASEHRSEVPRRLLCYGLRPHPSPSWRRPRRRARNRGGMTA